jgi:3-phosphoshikimate 1-carboxyvinyltransferase
MIIEIQKSELKGKLTAPPSKSVMIRAIAAGMLGDGVTRIYNPTYCDDAMAAISVAKDLGARVVQKKKHLKVIGDLHFTRKNIFCGESGLTARMFTPIASLCAEKIIITASPALNLRPLPNVVDTLQQLKVKCSDEDGFLPINLQGPLKGGDVKVDGSLSSQFISGLMFAMARTGKGANLEITNPKSKPYLNLTIQVLRDFGIKIKKKEKNLYKIKGNQFFKPHKYYVEGDWSGAAFLLAAAAIAGEVTVENLNLKSKQADIKILELLDSIGAKVEIEENSVKVSKNELNAFTFDAEHCPDLVPVAVALAANCTGESKIFGANRLLHKESNRAQTLQEEFSKMGIKIGVSDNILEVTGGKLLAAECSGHNDHRISMAVTIAALNSQEKIVLDNAECISKSYTNFYEDLKTIGARIS